MSPRATSPQTTDNPLSNDQDQALYYASRIYVANLRLRAMFPAERTAYYTLFANEVLTALKYMSTRTAGTPVPAVIVSARDALLRASQSGPAGWEFNPFDVELGSPEDVQLDDLLDTDLWWWEKYDVALGLSSQLSVSLDDLRYALKLVPTNAERMLDDGELSTTPLLRAASQSTSAPPSADPTITSPVALPMRKRVNCSAEEDEEDSDDNGDDNGDDDTFSPTSLRKKRPRAKSPEGQTSVAQDCRVDARRISDKEAQKYSEEYIIARVAKPTYGEFNVYLVGRTSEEKNKSACVTCRKAGVPCLVNRGAGRYKGCKLCTVRRAHCGAYKGPERLAPSTPAVSPRFIEKDEDITKLPPDYIVAEVAVNTNEGGLQRCLLGSRSSPRKKVECTACRAVGVPCFATEKGRASHSTRCVLCTLQRGYCAPATDSDQSAVDTRARAAPVQPPPTEATVVVSTLPAAQSTQQDAVLEFVYPDDGMIMEHVVDAPPVPHAPTAEAAGPARVGSEGAAAGPSSAALVENEVIVEAQSLSPAVRKWMEEYMEGKLRAMEAKAVAGLRETVVAAMKRLATEAIDRAFLEPVSGG